MRSLIADIRYSFRSLFRTWGFTAVAVAMLALPAVGRVEEGGSVETLAGGITESPMPGGRIRDEGSEFRHR